ncbi:MAG: hypothetical protein ACOX51_02225 [Myxococcota bacterium]|nr:hypothetical protein [Myxococcota bacterium]OQC39659.1 MAG: hypothetical protein BWX66_01091 [Deltaproteobacteria bacterium ADurb.Bin058]HHW95702.1 hypothetical protein [Oligoflexales bacterium]MBP8970510.1 hypothetical protein [Myxococcota bacterium]HQC44164.1 hypothetical protein [Myxococcota bacterium]
MRRLIVICALATLATSCASIDTATGVRQVAKDIDAARAERLDAGSKYEFEAALLYLEYAIQLQGRGEYEMAKGYVAKAQQALVQGREQLEINLKWQRVVEDKKAQASQPEGGVQP